MNTHAHATATANRPAQRGPRALRKRSRLMDMARPVDMATPPRLQAHGDLSLWPMCAQLCPSYAARVSRRQWMSAVSRLKVFALVIVLGAATGWTSSCGIGAAGSPVCTPAAGKPPGEGGPRLVTSDGFAAHAEPALAVDPHHPRSLLGAAQFARPGSFIRVPGTFFSADGGRTWHDNGPLPLPPGYAEGDDVSAAFAGGTGMVAAEIYPASGRGGGVYVWRTRDAGRRFSAPVPAFLVRHGGANTDHPSLAVATGPDGRPVITVAWAQGDSLLFSRSTDGAQTFSPARVISAPRDQHPDLAVAAPGPGQAVSVAYAAQSANGGTVVKVATSGNAGQTFGAPVTVPGAPAVAGPQSYEVSLIAAGADPRHGTLYVAFAQQAGQGGSLRAVVTHSTATGGWTAPAEVHPVAADQGSSQFQPALTVTPAGQAYVTYFVASSGRVAPLLSEVGGQARTQTLGAPFDSGCGLTAGVKTIPWLGDYQALTSSAGHLYAAWNDGGTGTLQILVRAVDTGR